MSNYNKYMLECIELAKQALEKGNPPVGSLLVFNDKIIGRGIESGKSTGDITQHAEILAVKDALEKGYRDTLNQSILISTHEPCIMCSYLIRHHKIAKIVFGVSVPSVKVLMLRPAWVNIASSVYAARACSSKPA